MWQCPKCERSFAHTDQHHYCGVITSIDEYIADQDVAVQPILHEMRAVIRAAAPDALEKISWRMPTFWQRQNLIHFAAFQKHIGIYPGDEAVRFFADRLGEFNPSKGSIRLPLDKPMPYELIAEITRWRVAAVSK